MDIVICPGCGETVPHENNGCPQCGYENNEDGRLLTLDELLAKPSYPKNGATRLNDVCPEFLRRLAEEARKTQNVQLEGPATEGSEPDSEAGRRSPRSDG